MKIYWAILSLSLAFGAFAFESNAQTAKRKKNVKRPPAARAQIVSASQIIEPEVISRAEDGEIEENGVVVNPSPARREIKNARQNAGADPLSNASDSSALMRELNSLRREVKTLREKSSVENLEKLGLAEERAENFRKKLEETMSRESDLSSKIQQLDFQMQPEAIARETAVIGSLRPEEVRESRRKTLEVEKTRLNEQLNQIRVSRARLEAAVASADALVEKLRLRVEAEDETSEAAATKSKDSQTKKNENAGDDETQIPPQ